MIQINLLRISPDSKYLEFSVECPTNYIFNTLIISRYNPTTHLYITPAIDASSIYTTSTKQVVRLATSIFGVDTTMYKVEFGITPTAGGPPINNIIGICSNVNFVYENLLSLILNFTNCCISDSDYDSLDRNYMILYAHQEAMRLERPEAEYFYDIIWKLFSKCNSNTRQINGITNPCNCS